MKKTFTPFVCAFIAQFFYFAFLTAQPTSFDNVNPIRVVVDHPTIDWEIDVTQSLFGGEINLANVPPSGIIARTDDGVTEPTDNDTWTPVGWYGCLEPINGAELDGKIVFISRGACEFGLKILNVEKHGAIGAIIGNRAPIGITVGSHNPGLISMAPGAVGDSVTIPGVFMTHEDRESLVALLDAEQELTVTFEAPYIYNVAAAYAHYTPLSQVVSLDHIQMVIINRDTLPLVDVALNASILEPDGNVVALQAIRAIWAIGGGVDSTFNEAIAGTIDTIIPQRETGRAASGGLLAGEYQIFFESYTPSQAGEYTVTFSASTAAGNHPIDSEMVTNTFVVSDGFSYSVGNGIVSNPNGMSIRPEVYADSFFVFNTGTVFRTGDKGAANVTFASFGLANPDELEQGLEFEAKIYDFADTDDDGFGDSPGDELASATYVLTGAETPNAPIFIEYDSPVSLGPNSTYLLMIEHVGFDFDNFTPPAYATTGSLSQTVGFGTVYQLGAGFVNGGFEYWNGGAPDWPYGGRQTMVGVHLEGFVITDVKETLAENKVNLSPNPTSGVLFLELVLEDFADEVNIVFSDILGKRIRYETLEGVKAGTFEFRINDFTTGTYFMTVETPEGFRTMKFVVVK